MVESTPVKILWKLETTALKILRNSANLSANIILGKAKPSTCLEKPKLKNQTLTEGIYPSPEPLGEDTVSPLATVVTAKLP